MERPTIGSQQSSVRKIAAMAILHIYALYFMSMFSIFTACPAVFELDLLIVKAENAGDDATIQALACHIEYGVFGMLCSHSGFFDAGAFLRDTYIMRTTSGYVDTEVLSISKERKM